MSTPVPLERPCPEPVDESGLPLASQGTEARNFAAGFSASTAAVGTGAGSPQSAAIFCAYCGLTREMTCRTDVSRRRRNGAGYRPIHTARIRSGANVANSRWLRSRSRSFFGFSTLPNIVR